ncbi:MAG: thioredoxin domain-containing protein [Pseudomonadota bacterium]
MRLLPALALTLLLGCVPRAVHRNTVQQLQQARAAAATQQAQIATLRAQVESLETRCGAARAPAGPPPVQATSFTAMDLQVPALLALPWLQQQAAMSALNGTVGPCAPCVDEGLSAAACLMTHRECLNIPGLAARVARGAARSQEPAALAELLHYDKPWKGVAIGDAPVRGGRRDAVVVVMFMDVQCPFCARAYATMDALAQRYGDRLLFVFKHMPLPFHHQAMPAALAMEAAGRQGRFWEYHDALFARASELREEGLLDEVAVSVGLDLGRFHRDLEDPALAARVAADQAQAQAAGLTGTPSFLVAGYPLVGAQPLDSFAAAIDRELAD